MAGKTIQIYVPSGDPREMRIAEITTRIVRAFEIPRSQLQNFLNREESSQVGVYFLFGDDKSDLPAVYIGQSGAIGQRLVTHNAQKEFWTRAVAVVSLTNNWTQTHVTYLEWLCIKESSSIDRYQIENGNQGSKPHTPEALEADCQEVFDTMRILLTTFERLIVKNTGELSTALTTYRCTGAGGADALGQYTAEGFFVFKKSKARKQLVDSLQAHPPSVARRQALVSSGKLVDVNETLVFTEDMLFSSPSAASNMVLGRTSNGWIDWVTEDGRTLDSVERHPS
jgi:Domain of unknown function (DUF4357)